MTKKIVIPECLYRESRLFDLTIRAKEIKESRLEAAPTDRIKIHDAG